MILILFWLLKSLLILTIFGSVERIHILHSVQFWILAAVLFLAVFLKQVNDFLRGRYKEYLDAYLGLIWVVLIVLSFVLFNWKVCLMFLFGSFIFGAIIIPIAERFAAYLLHR